MLTDREIKKKYGPLFSKNPDKYFPTSMKTLGFTRKNCSKCKRFFWSTIEQNVCGDAKCSGGFKFIGNTPAKKKMNYIDLWKNFVNVMKKQGYTEIKRYPVPARWRDDLYFVEASIDDFMPYVINGVVDPPAEYIIVPQPCLRFSDIDSTGLTGSHYTCFIMIGQLTFQQPENYDFNSYLLHLLKWYTDGMKIPIDEITLHEDIWAGSGNFGNSLEVFSRGLELSNQVYMQYRATEDGYKDLGLKVLDMGLGYERNAWFSKGTGSSYETSFPTVVKKLKQQTGLKEDKEMMKSFLPYAAYLNIDEIDDVEKTWNTISKNTGYDPEVLKEGILPLSSLYSIAEHTRNLLIAISDGALPSNTGGGYNLRVIFRRSLSFMDKYGWDIDLNKIAQLHASYLKPLFPELSKKISEVDEILKVEKERYENTKEKSKQIVANIIKKNVTEEKLLELYDSKGILPEVIKDEASKLGNKIEIPDDFYAKVAEKHRRIEKRKKLDLNIDNIPKTKTIYYENQDTKEFEAYVLKIIDKKYVIFDETCFYPRGGGQEPDFGKINGCKVYDGEKIDGVIIHFVENLNFKEGDKIKGVVDWERRIQLTQHHTATHIINGISIKVLGNHVFQAGAFKGQKKAHIDLTHYKNLTEDEIGKIEKEANKMIKAKLKVTISWIKRNVAEKKYGFDIYQGGAVPGKEIRIVNISNKDIEACGGTHLDNTIDVGKIIITKTERIQDGIVRLEYVAGKAAKKEEMKQKRILKECSEILGVDKKNLIKETKKLFSKWKKTRKDKEKNLNENVTLGLEEIKKQMKNDVLITTVDGDMKYIQGISKKLSNDNSLIILISNLDKIFVFGSAGKNRKENIGKIISYICNKLNGKGGGSDKLGQGIGFDKNKIENILKELKKEFGV